MVTYDDLIHLIGKLDRQKSDLSAELLAQTNAWKGLREEVRLSLRSILKDINITDVSKHPELSSYDALSSIKGVQKEVASLEQKVKEALNEWEKSLNLLRENPSLQLEKRIWKSFVIDGKKLETDVYVMRK